MKRFLTTAWLLVTVVACMMAQGGAVRGKIVDAQTKEALEFVTVSVSKAGSSDLLKGTVTDIDGNFNIKGLSEGSYTLSITFIGYKEMKRNFSITRQAHNVNLRTLTIREDSKMLGEVQVTGQRAQMKFEIDKKVFDVDQNIAATGGSASDVLTNIPSVEVDSEGEVSLRGSSSVKGNTMTALRSNEKNIACFDFPSATFTTPLKSDSAAAIFALAISFT